MLYKGSCLCRHVTFEVKGDFEKFLLCHCQRCRKDTGSAHAANLFSSKAQLKWLSGQQNVKTFHLDLTRHLKSFCMNCGSALPSVQMDGTLLMVPAGSLDSEVTLIPEAHIFWGNRATWDQNLETVHKQDKLSEN